VASRNLFLKAKAFFSPPVSIEGLSPPANSIIEGSLGGIGELPNGRINGLC